MSDTKRREKKSKRVKVKLQPKKNKDGSITSQHPLPGSAGELPGIRKVFDTGT